MKEKVNGIVLSNDGERAIVRMPDDTLLHCDRVDPLIEEVQSVSQFLEDFVPGEVSPSFEKWQPN